MGYNFAWLVRVHNKKGLLSNLKRHHSRILRSSSPNYAAFVSLRRHTSQTPHYYLQILQTLVSRHMSSRSVLVYKTSLPCFYHPRTELNIEESGKEKSTAIYSHNMQDLISELENLFHQPPFPELISMNNATTYQYDKVHNQAP